VGPFDRLTVDVLGIEALTGREVQVDGDGNIALPMVGAVNVAGRTTSEVRVLVTERLRAAYVRDPQVSVGLREAVSQVLTIGGQVARPGVYPVMGEMTLLRALAVAGDTREDADLQDVIVFRTVAGQRYAALYDVERIRHGAYPDPEIYANDLVMVGDDQSRRLFREVLSTFSLVSGPLVIMIDRIAN
jgi:polysaccharide export outer membrane protein